MATFPEIRPVETHFLLTPELTAGPIYRKYHLASDPSLMPTAVDEILRYGTPIIYFRRTATLDTVIRGVPTRAGARVALWYVAANFDEAVFPDPYHFDVGRHPNPHVTFGRGGPHFCLGSFLARLEIRILLEEDPGAERPLRADRPAGSAQLELHQRLQVVARARRRRALKGGAIATVEAPSTTRRIFLPGEWIDPGSSLEVRSPYSGDVVATVARAGAEEARRAIDAAVEVMREPLPPWRRAEILERVAQLVREHGEELARTICAEAGKPIKAARVEAARVVNRYALAAGEARTLADESVPITGTQPGDGHFAWTVRVPIGVIGAITPFNFPVNLVAHKWRRRSRPDARSS